MYRRRTAILLVLIALPALAAPDFSVGDAAFQHRYQGERAREALAAYRVVLQSFPDDNAAAWRFAMASQFVGHRLTTDTDEKASLFRDGRDVALAAAKRDDRCAPCHFWGGVDMALYGETVGTLKTLATLPTVREHLRTAATLDATYAFGGPDRVLGEIDRKLPGLFGGDDDRAEAHFEKAIAAAPGNPLNYLFFSRFLDENRGDAARALAIAKKGLEFPPPAREEIESFEAYSELAELRDRYLLVFLNSPPN